MSPAACSSYSAVMQTQRERTSNSFVPFSVCAGYSVSLREQKLSLMHILATDTGSWKQPVGSSWKGICGKLSRVETNVQFSPAWPSTQSPPSGVPSAEFSRYFTEPQTGSGWKGAQGIIWSNLPVQAGSSQGTRHRIVSSGFWNTSS